MKKESAGGLFNLAEVSKQVKKADTIFWYIAEDGAHVVSDGHFIFRFFGQCDALFTRFQQRPQGEALNSMKGREVFEAKNMRKNFEQFLSVYQEAACTDTRLTYDSAGKAVRIIYTEDGSKRDYVYLSAEYFGCIAQAETISQEAASRTKPVTFTTYEETEKAVILPVHIEGVPGCLASL